MKIARPLCKEHVLGLQKAREPHHLFSCSLSNRLLRKTTLEKERIFVIFGHRLPATLGLIFFLIVNVVGGAASLADGVDAGITEQKSAPAALTRCVVDYGLGAQYAYYLTSFNLYNRSVHSLIDVSVEYRFYDRDRTQIGRSIVTYTPVEPVASGDTVPFNKNAVNVELSEGPTAVSKVACRITAAHYTGRITWKVGTAWTGGSLTAIPKEPTSDGDSPKSGTNESVASAPQSPRNVKIDVVNAWIDHYQGHLFVHDALVIHGNEANLVIRPSDVVLKLNLADGSHKQYEALATPAPVYQKFDFTKNQYALVNTVDPPEDLGHLGSLAVSAHSDAKITATFFIADVPADATAIKDVSIR